MGYWWLHNDRDRYWVHISDSKCVLLYSFYHGRNWFWFADSFTDHSKKTLILNQEMGDIMHHTDNKLVAVCGLYCGACTLYIASQEDPKRLKAMADRFQLSVEEVSCNGCRSEKRSPYCEQCKMFSCAWDRGFEFCYKCPDYPCADLKLFQLERPHRNELWQDNARIKEIGSHKWLQEIKKNYTCPHCGIINSAYDLKCRKCSEEPSCYYVAKHQKDIKKILKNM